MRFLSGILILVSIFTISCEKKKSSSGVNSGTRYPAGVTAGSIYGYVTINSACGTNTATVQLYSINSNQVLFSLQVINGGTYQFQTTAGSYTLVASAGNNCYVSGPVQADATRAMGYDLNIANYGTNNGFANTNYNNCNINTFGCSGSFFKAGVSSTPGVYSSSRIYVSGSDNEKLNLKLSLKNNSALIAATPAHSESGWDGTIKDNKLVISELAEDSSKKDISYENLQYDSQIDESQLQSEYGECVEASQVIASLRNEMKLLSFRPAVINDMAEVSNSKLPKLNGTVCIYPQVKEQIEKSVQLEVSKDHVSKRVLFLLVPQGDTQARFKKPKKDAIALLKGLNKTRTIAQSQLSVEEWSIGFLIEK